jgi:hypothetical protein
VYGNSPFLKKNIKFSEDSLNYSGLVFLFKSKITPMFKNFRKELAKVYHCYCGNA